jgi:uncharacterized membrane protein YadS|tara:strand:+ start:2202 stop:3047 length:846 start_codon:yes stop_codon:yes gene_type:complete
MILGLLLSLGLTNNIQILYSKADSLPLQIGIALIGFSISLELLLDISLNFFPIISFFVFFIFLISLIIGKCMKLDSKFIYLIASASAICGASAALAISSIIKPKNTQILSALSIIFIFNAIALLLLPYIGTLLNLTDFQFGFLSALAIHDTSSVVGAGFLYSNEAGEIAATLKLGRTLWLLPLIFLVAYIFNTKTDNTIKSFPKFIVFFFLFILLGNLLNIHENILDIIKKISLIFINLGIFMIGVQSKLTSIMSYKLVLYPVFIWVITLSSSLLIVYNFS